MSNITTITPPPKREKPSASDIHTIVIRAKQIVDAVRVAQEHDHEGNGGYQYALEQVYDMLNEAGGRLSDLEDAEDRESQQ